MKSFLAGLGLGSAIGLAIAPEIGSETRTKLLSWGAGVAESLEKRLGPAVNRGARAEGGSTNDEKESPSTQDAVAEVLNNASKTKLRNVPGIGDATARRIIENRPFESEAEVLEGKVIPEKVLKTLKDKLVEGDEEVA